jgi:hypothetical protein
MLLPYTVGRGGFSGLKFWWFAAEHEFVDRNVPVLAMDGQFEAVGQNGLQHGAEHRGLQGGISPVGQIGLGNLGVDIIEGGGGIGGPRRHAGDLVGAKAEGSL